MIRALPKVNEGQATDPLATSEDAVALESPLLGFLIFNPSKFQEVTARLRADDFQDLTARKVFQAMSALGGDFDAPRLLGAVPHASLHLGKMMQDALATTSGPFGAMDAARRIQEAGRRRRAQDQARVIADAAKRGSLEDLQAAIQGLHEEPQSQGKIRFLRRSEIMQLPDPKWTVKKLLLDAGISCFHGESTVGKSFLALDLLISIAEGRKWFGRKVKKRDVFYLALEGEGGIKKRIRAWEIANGRDIPDNLVLIHDYRLDLRDRQSCTELSNSLPKDCIIVIDTLSQAAPGADENSSTDGTTILNNCAFLKQQSRNVVLIAHPGKDLSRGIRGWSGLFGALDCNIEVSRDGGKYKWTAKKVKDGIDGFSEFFERRVVEMGVDEDGDKDDSCVIVPCPIPAAIKKLTMGMRIGMESFELAVRQTGAGGTDIETWRRAFYQLHTGDGDEAKKKAFQRSRADLVDHGHLCVRNDFYTRSGAEALCAQEHNGGTF
jgi:hypothetical protein